MVFGVKSLNVAGGPSDLLFVVISAVCVGGSVGVDLELVCPSVVGLPVTGDEGVVGVFCTLEVVICPVVRAVVCAPVVTTGHSHWTGLSEGDCRRAYNE